MSSNYPCCCPCRHWSATAVKAQKKNLNLPLNSKITIDGMYLTTVYLNIVLKYNFEEYFNVLLLYTSNPIHLLNNFSYKLLCRYRLFTVDRLFSCDICGRKIYEAPQDKMSYVPCIQVRSPGPIYGWGHSPSWSMCLYLSRSPQT